MDFHSRHNNHMTWAEVMLKGNTMIVLARFEKTKKNDRHDTIIRKDIKLWLEN